MGDVDDAFPLFLEITNDIEQNLDFLNGQSGCRLVHYNDLGIQV